MGLEEMEWSQATRGQEDPISHDAAVRVYHTSLGLVLRPTDTSSPGQTTFSPKTRASRSGPRRMLMTKNSGSRSTLPDT